MHRTVWAAAAAFLGIGIITALPARAAAEAGICPMGGAMIAAPTDKDKALAWAAGRRRAEVSGEESDAWSVLALSDSSREVAILLGPGGVFFGVAGRGGEVYPRDIEKAFGSDLRRLREAVRRDLGDLWKAGVVGISGGDVQKIADAAGLGVVAKEGSAWALTTRECQAVDLPSSGLR